MKIRKNDTILVVSGKDRGKKGKVLTSFPKISKILVEGVNLRKKHQKPKKQGEKGQVVLMPGPISVSNVKIVCSKCGNPVKIGYKVLEKNKIRFCKKCNQEI
ncbi:MAG: 50S ribosomal protein L24 [Candidatus Nealsonbacteria bacterium]|nr:50S ribosomal protein L24 [Candidatus Nealsonbacteria bacterium]